MRTESIILQFVRAGRASNRLKKNKKQIVKKLRPRNSKRTGKRIERKKPQLAIEQIIVSSCQSDSYN